MIKVADGEFFREGESIELPPSFEFIDTYRQAYVYGQKNGRWGRLVSYHQNYLGHGPGWLVEKIDIARHCCTA